MKALANFFGDAAAVFRRRGALLARLGCVLRYWFSYERGRLRGLGRDESRLQALAAMSADGALRRVVRVELGEGLNAELDVYCAVFLVREILDDGTYRRPGFVPEPGWTVVDVGAHQGIFTLDAARRVGSAGRVIAVEPFAFNRELLERNVAANELGNVSVCAQAAAETRETKTLYATPLSTGWQSLVLTGEGRVPMPIEAERLDAILSARGVGRVDLLKIDVEGAWRLVFAGAPELLAQRPRVVMEVEGDDAEVAAATSRLRELGYAVERDHSVLFASASLEKR